MFLFMFGLMWGLGRFGRFLIQNLERNERKT